MFGGRYLIGCVLLFACGALGFPRAPIDMEPPLALQAVDAPPPDQETYGYLLPRLATKYRPSLAWGGVSDPRLYVLTELDDVQDVEDPMRAKRRQPSLSIVNPMDVLRQRLLLEIARKKMKDNAERNREFLKNVGKRDSMSSERSLAELYNADQKSEDKKVADFLANQRTAL